MIKKIVLQDKERAWLKRRRADYQDVEADADDDQEADDEEETDTPTMSDQEFVASEPEFPLAQSYPRDIMSTDDEETEINAFVDAHDAPTQPCPSASPPRTPVLGGGIHDSDIENEEVRKFLSPFLWGKTVDGREDIGFAANPTPTITLNVHIPDTRRLDELLYLVRLDPKLRLILDRFKSQMNGVAVSQNKYRQHSNGGRFYGIGCSMQFVPKWIRNYLFGDNCIYLDCTNTWAFALVNLKRVMEIDMETPILDEYVSDPVQFRSIVQRGLKFPEMTSKVKQLILWAVHGYDGMDSHLSGNALSKVTELTSEVDLLTVRLLDKPQLSQLLSNFKATESATEQLEIAANAIDTDAPADDVGGALTPKKPKKPKKAPKSTDASMFVLNPEHHIRCTSSMGRRVSALYTLVESETTYALQKFLDDEEEFDTQILIFDGLVARPRQDYLKCVRDLDGLCERAREYVRSKFGWDMQIKAECMDSTRSQFLMLNGPKVFHDLPPLAQLIRHVIYALGEKRGLKRFGNALLEEVPGFPSLYQILRYPVKGSTGCIVGTSQDPMPLIHATLDTSPYSAYASCAHEKKLFDWFMENQDMRFEKFYMRGTNMWQVRFQDGLVDFHTDDNVPIFRDWNFFKSTGASIPVHFLSYPTVNYNKTVQHIRDFESGARPDSPAPLFDAFIQYQLCKEDIQTLRILLGRMQMPLKDGWNVCVIITGPEQVGKSVILNEIKHKVPLAGQLVKVLTGKSSDKFPLGDITNKHLVVTDEAESLISKLGYDLLKSLVSNGAFDADVKYKSETSRPDGAGLLLVGVGNSLLDQTQYIDKAFVERVAWFKFEKLVDDKNRDPTLAVKLGTERGVHHIWQALAFLNCMKTPNLAHKFWLNVASPNLRENRELAKLEGDLTAQLINNHSDFYRVLPDPNALPLFVDELQKALMSYMQMERKMDPKKLPRNWIDAVKRVPYYSVRKEEVCSRCHTFAPTKRTCSGHYSKFLITKRNVIYGMDLQHYPLGIQFAPEPSSAQVVLVEDDAGDEEKDPAPVAPAAMDPSLFAPRRMGVETPAGPLDACDEFCVRAMAETPAKYAQLAVISRMALPPEEKMVVRTYRRRQARALYVELESFAGADIDRILSMGQKDTAAAVKSRARSSMTVVSRPIQIGDMWRPIV